MLHELRGLFLDFDGTIAETERFGHRVAYNRAFAERNLAWHWDEALYADLLRVAGGKERLRFFLGRDHPELHDAAAREQLIDELYRAKVEHFTALAPRIPFRPGVQRLIGEAHAAGLRVAIVTTGSRAGVQSLLAQDAALSEMFDLLATNESVEKKKPAPDVYEWALAQLDLAPEACVAVEDSHVGVCAALAAGIATLVTVSDYTAREDFTGAAAVLSSLGDSARIARSISGIAPRNGLVDLEFLRAIQASATPNRVLKNSR